MLLALALYASVAHGGPLELVLDPAPTASEGEPFGGRVAGTTAGSQWRAWAISTRG